MFAAATFSCPFAHADDTLWTLTTSDLSTRSVNLSGIANGSISIAGDPNPASIPLDHFVSIQRSTPIPITSATFTLYLTDGQRLAGEPAGIQKEQLLWHTTSAGDIPVPLRRLQAMTRAVAPAPPPGADKSSQDRVTLANGDSVAGIIADLSAQKLTIESDAGSSDVPLDSVTAIAFASSAAAPPAQGRAFRLSLDDGFLFDVASVSLDGEKVTFVTNAGKSKSLDLSHLQAIEQINGPVRWLSSIPPDQQVQTSWIGGSPSWPARMNHSVAGDPIRFDDQTFPRGIGVHAYSRLTFPLSGQWAVFRTQYAIDTAAVPDIGNRLADVTVRVLLDGKIVHEHRHFRPGELAGPVLIDLGSARQLTLEVDYGQSADSQARLNWIEPVLLRTKPGDVANNPPASTQP